MDINKLLHFRAVVETKSVRKAAEVLSMSPGALSKSLRIFSEEIELDLLAPAGRGIIITEAGQELYQKSHRLIEELSSLKLNLRQTTQDKIKLATYEVFSTHFLSEFIAQEKIENIACEELSPGDIEKEILARRFDYGLTLIPFPEEGLDHLIIGKTSVKTFCTNQSSFIKEEQKNLKYAVPITTLESNPSQSIIIDGWPVHIPRKINYEFHMLETALQVASNHTSVVYCPELVIKLFNKKLKAKNQLVPHSTKKTNQVMNIFLVKRKETPEDSFTKKIAKFIRSL